MKINVPLSQIDIFLKRDGSDAKLRVIRRIESPYRFEIKWYILTCTEGINMFFRLNNKFGSAETTSMMNGKKCKRPTDTVRHTWKLD